MPDTVATNQIGAALEAVDLLDKVIERGNFAGELSPQLSSLTFKNDRGDHEPHSAWLGKVGRKAGVPDFPTSQINHLAALFGRIDPVRIERGQR
ncbi:MAG: hypothetical protein ACRCR1_08335 [Aeromonas sp.]